MSILHEHPLMVKSFALIWISNNLVKSKNFNIRMNESLFFKSSNTFYYSSFHSKDNSFLRRSKSGFNSCEKPFINFQQKLVRPMEDQIPLTMTGFFQSHMASNFLRSGLTPSCNKICPKKSISSQANSLFRLLVKIWFSWNLFKTYFKCSTCSFIVLEYTNRSLIQMIMNSSNFLWKIQFMKVVNVDKTL